MPHGGPHMVTRADASYAEVSSSRGYATPSVQTVSASSFSRRQRPISMADLLVQKIGRSRRGDQGGAYQPLTPAGVRPRRVKAGMFEDRPFGDRGGIHQ